MTDDSRSVDAIPGRLTRREFLAASAAATAMLSAGRIGDAFGAAPAVDHTLRAAPYTHDLGGTQAKTWAFNGRIPGPEIRVRQGQRVRIKVENALTEETTVHWHGIRLKNAMDGLPDITQPPIKPGGSFVYDFVAPDAGTYFFHPHVGLQLDMGLYGALIVEPRNEPLSYDRDVVIMLDDWLDGVGGRTPMKEFETLQRLGMPMGMHDGAGHRPFVDLSGKAPAAATVPWAANLLEGASFDAGDVRYPYFLINGQPPSDPYSLRVRKRERIRLRLINTAADTIFSFQVAGHPLTVVACDGQAVEPRKTDAVVLGMGERIDVLLEATGSGAHEIAASALGKHAKAVGVLRYSDSTTKTVAPVPKANIKVAGYGDLHTPSAPSLGDPSRTIRLGIGMNMMRGYVWTLGGQAYPDADVISIKRGEIVDIEIANRTMMQMVHPMHLHGNFFQIAGSNGRALLKDTVLVGPSTTMPIRLHATNPGRWVLHCHNDYHMMSGMMREVRID